MSSRIATVEQDITALAERVDTIASQVNGILERVDRMSRDIGTMAATVAAVADDTLRACIVLEEMATAKRVPPPPWTLATLLVELHHANLALTQGDVPDDGTPIEDRIRHLTERVALMREEYRHGPTPPIRSTDGV